MATPQQTSTTRLATTARLCGCRFCAGQPGQVKGGSAGSDFRLRPLGERCLVRLYATRSAMHRNRLGRVIDLQTPKQDTYP
eukprot:scaffold408727_cov11-Prasinocladus_malaysianus.AAC.1